MIDPPTFFDPPLALSNEGALTDARSTVTALPGGTRSQFRGVYTIKPGPNATDFPDDIGLRIELPESMRWIANKFEFVTGTVTYTQAGGLPVTAPTESPVTWAVPPMYLRFRDLPVSAGGTTVIDVSATFDGVAPPPAPAPGGE